MMEKLLSQPNMFGGVLEGLLVTAMTGGLGLYLMVWLARRSRVRAWRWFGSLFVLLLVGCLLTAALRAPELPPVFEFRGHPSSYGRTEGDVSLHTLLLFACPGLCALLAAVVTVLLARRQGGLLRDAPARRANRTPVG